MGQPKVTSVTWPDRIRRISQGFYETMGQQIPQTRSSKPMRAWSHVKILNRDLRSTVIFLRKPKGIGQTFRLRGRHCRELKHRGSDTFPEDAVPTALQVPCFMVPKHAQGRR